MIVFWLVAAVATALSVALLTAPLASRAMVRVEPAARHAQRVHRAQLDEVAHDLASGAIGADEAEAARAEIGRRLLASAAADDTAPDATPPRRVAAMVLTALVPIAALGLYLFVGVPDLPQDDMPPEAARAIAAAERLETRLMIEPDAQGWLLVGETMKRLGRYDRSENAFAEAAKLLPDDPSVALAQAEARVLAADGRVDEVSANLLLRAPAHPTSRFWLAERKLQQGDRDGALAALDALLASEPNAAWAPMVQSRLATLRGPTDADVAAVAGMSGEQQQAFIESMVARLAARLETTPDDVEGWRKLARAYRTMGRTDAARAAFAKLAALRPDDEEARAALR
ncbi:c-type cytochrome biogenesis protein CcmI [Roseiterribacter gracilis]|uniref:Cytochrome c-type biogenesis protein CycH n=1 Tax=Roseiterribacter gracilis TaxID=2812848 RepID=A0A8S8XC62_9PROT|nr:cytochrome c-type biogenesis protein CycH [Rhodospirillales bacterium TMPK1]